MDEHELTRKMLPLAAAGALEFEELRRVEQHAEVCKDCRHELETWNRYAQALRHLPPPAVPAGLIQRTQTRILQQNRTAAGDRVNAVALGAIAILGWAMSLVMWALVRSLTSGALIIQAVNVISPLSWWLLSAVLAWITTAASALVLVRRREIRSSL